MVRFVTVFLLGCLLIAVGTALLILVAWALAAAGVGGPAPEVVAIGLAILLPCSFLLAGTLIPGPPRPPCDLLVCPHCGVPSPVWIRPGAPTEPAGGREPTSRDPHGSRSASAHAGPMKPSHASV